MLSRIQHACLPFCRKGVSLIQGLAISVFVASVFSSCVLKTADVESHDGKSVKTEDGVCHHVNPGSSLHPVVLCERKEDLQLKVLGKTRTYPKKAIEREVTVQMRALINVSDMSPRYLKEATAELWVSAPVLSPQTAQLVVVVKSKAAGFAVTLPADMDRWDFLTSQVVQLGPQGYPARETFKSGKLVLVADSSIRSGDWQRFEAHVRLASGKTPAGRDRIKNFYNFGEGISFETEVFSEAHVARTLQNTGFGRKYKLRPRFLPALEMDSYKARGYVFRVTL